MLTEGRGIITWRSHFPFSVQFAEFILILPYVIFSWTLLRLRFAFKKKKFEISKKNIFFIDFNI